MQDRIRRTNEIIHSVNKEQTSSEDGVFFDGEISDIDISYSQSDDGTEIKAKRTSSTSDSNIRFSLADIVEETKDLIAVHILRGQELLKSLELGGLPIPSVAIIKAQVEHEMYGDVT